MKFWCNILSWTWTCMEWEWPTKVKCKEASQVVKTILDISFSRQNNSGMSYGVRSEVGGLESLSSDLVVRALNYHGQQLTSFIKETNIYGQLDMKNVDYHLYHQRSRELRMEDRGKRLLLHRWNNYSSMYCLTMTLQVHITELWEALQGEAGRGDSDQHQDGQRPGGGTRRPTTALWSVHQGGRGRQMQTFFWRE